MKGELFRTHTSLTDHWVHPPSPLESRFSTLIDEGPNEVITILFFCKELDHVPSDSSLEGSLLLAAWRVSIT